MTDNARIINVADLLTEALAILDDMPSAGLAACHVSLAIESLAAADAAPTTIDDAEIEPIAPPSEPSSAA